MGENAIGVSLGDGWYRGFIGFEGQRNYYGDTLALLAQIRILYEDGDVQIGRYRHIMEILHRRPNPRLRHLYG